MARCIVERPLREFGTTGAVRRRKVITMLSGGRVERAPDRLERAFVDEAVNRCWVADFTYVRTWAATVYVGFGGTPFPAGVSAARPPPSRMPFSSWTLWRWPFGNVTAINIPSSQESRFITCTPAGDLEDR
ncbi:hypothetical protein ACFC09_03285 [Streptomyces sp. NPDC056161]|uniref:hypothetical protein n=1 Tax=unclassified Streptomyces TaxID=2593676 RepID=UPI0035DBCE46